MTDRPMPSAHLRGVAVGTSTPILAAAAHAAAGGGLPSGAGAVHLALLAMTVGGVSAVVRHGDRFVVLLALLAVGQAIGHTVLGGHHHGPGPSGTATVMLAFHAAAIAVIAALVAVGDALCRVVSRVIAAATPRPTARVRAASVPVLRRCTHPMRAALLLAASWSYRGPPVSVAR